MDMDHADAAPEVSELIAAKWAASMTDMFLVAFVAAGKVVETNDPYDRAAAARLKAGKP